jgi:hypothetical protein
LEATFLLNLCILAVGTYHVTEIEGNQAALTYTSVGVAFVFFVCIMLYHTYLCLRTLLKKLPKLDSKRYYIFNNLKIVQNLLGNDEKENDDKEEIESETQSVQTRPTTSTCGMELSQLREPLLEEI